ncbi:integumentary mucin B.1-like [Spea bombifrons]|uniref:integumentary mucin B.1-like n=1 Tax=Spea bombifrons TaxID=233779 RepID=UPI002349A162|nr:integumentary mucin B.1-like [Spea bombifrons]
MEHHEGANDKPQNIFLMVVLCVQHGDMWSIGCEVCKCNGKTGQMECFPYPCEQDIACNENERIVFDKPSLNSGKSCCGHCVPVTCRFNHTEYEVGATFRDPAYPCVSYSCELSGLSVTVNTCPNQLTCSEDRRSYDENGCCYTCDTKCKPSPSLIKIQHDLQEHKNCSGMISITKCSGDCQATEV